MLVPPGSAALLQAGAHCGLVIIAPHPSQLNKKPVEIISPRTILCKQGEVSITPDHQLLEFPRVSSPGEDTPGKDSAFLISSFSFGALWWESLMREILPSAMQTNYNFWVQKLVSYDKNISCLEEGSLSQVRICVQSVVTLSLGFSSSAFFSYCLFITSETLNFSNNDPDNYSHLTQP